MDLTASTPLSSLSPSTTTISRRKQHPSSSSSPSTSRPISIRSSSTAQAFAHAHPLLLVSLFAGRFGALVADPVSALAELLPVVCAVQAVYVVLCLPAAGKDGSGGSGGGSAARDRSKMGQKRRIDGDGGFGGKIVPAIISLLLPLLLGTPFLAMLLVLFGAPITTHIPHTLLCAAHMSVLAGTSLVYVHGTDGSIWREIWGASRPVDSVWGAAVGTALGAWLGAVPIPLDWDRPWQAYPITIVTGAYVGYALGSSMGRTPLLYGKRIEFTAEEPEIEAAPMDIKDKMSPKQIESSTNKVEAS